MYNHVSFDYICPLCLAIRGVENEQTMMKQADIFYRDELFIGAINSKFVKNNPGHAIIFPIKHFEHLYDLEEQATAQTMLVAKKVALALKEVRKCDGVTLLQNNEPASEQHAFHFHMNIFPRFNNDNLSEHIHQAQVSQLDERTIYAQNLRSYFQTYDR